MKIIAALLLSISSCVCLGQSLDLSGNPYSRRQTFEVFAEGAYTSSHILMGGSRNRQLGGFGGAYEYRLFNKRFGSLSYRAEVLPVVFESDPYAHTISEYITPLNGTTPPFPYETRYKTIGKCQPGQFVYVIDSQDSIIGATGCGRQRTFAQTFTPLGFRYNGYTRHRLQPFFSGTLGYMYSNRPVPVENAGSLNFEFDFGAGFEWYVRPKRSFAVQYVFHHFSNNYTATGTNGVSSSAGSNTCATSSTSPYACEGGLNPGVDNMMLKIGYRFGH